MQNRLVTSDSAADATLTDEEAPAPTAATLAPGTALDPLVALATNLHAAPGVYALLLGSGVSTGAGVPTGWGVVVDLVRRAAAAADPADPGAGDAAAENPDGWWAEHGDGQPLGYSTLLAQLAPSAAARQQLLAGYFEASEEDREAGRKVPGPAHRAVARLVARGAVRVVLTTNFDRLLEQALVAEGVQAQVLTRPESVDAAQPLAHARATVVKLHGDYADLNQRNTVDELAAYPAALDALLDRVRDEYGLLICGWSADYDTALVAALEGARRRRYPLFMGPVSRGWRDESPRS